jgi:uncharacterized protein YpbB
MAYNEDIRDLFETLALQQHLIHSCLEGFSVDAFHQHKNNFQLPYFSVNAHAKGSTNAKIISPHPELYQQLKKLRDSICDRTNAALYMVAAGTTLDEMARYLPQTLTDLKKINGFGDAKVEKYGLQFLDIITRYCNEHDLATTIQEKVPKKEKKEKSTIPKVDTKQESFKLYKSGKSIAEIALERNLTVTTIETHLAHFVSSGEIKIEELVSREKIVIIEPALDEYEEGKTLTSIKEKLGNNISFGEIRLVMAWKEFESTIS